MTCERPSTDVERSSSMPLIVLSAPSSFLVISVSICSGDEPGFTTETDTVGMSILGSRSTPSPKNAYTPTTVSERTSIVANTGRRTQSSASLCMVRSPSARASAGATPPGASVRRTAAPSASLSRLFVATIAPS